MSELIEIPKWFDDIYKEVIRVIEDDFSYIHEPEDKANELLIKAISNHGYGEFWTDDLIRESLFPSADLINMIQHKEDEKIEYVSHNKIDLIRAIVNGYKVKEDKYIVVSINDHEDYRIYPSVTSIKSISIPFSVKYLYYENEKHLEKYRELDSGTYKSGFDSELAGKVTQDFIKTLNGLEPKLIMTKEKAEGLINSYRTMIPIN